MEQFASFPLFYHINLEKYRPFFTENLGHVQNNAIKSFPLYYILYSTIYSVDLPKIYTRVAFIFKVKEANNFGQLPNKRPSRNTNLQRKYCKLNAAQDCRSYADTDICVYIYSHIYVCSVPTKLATELGQFPWRNWSQMCQSTTKSCNTNNNNKKYTQRKRGRKRKREAERERDVASCSYDRVRLTVNLGIHYHNLSTSPVPLDVRATMTTTTTAI